MKILTSNFNKKSFITGILSVILQKFSEQIMTYVDMSINKD